MKLSDEAITKMHEYGIPPHMHHGLVLYLEQGLPPGDFLVAVIENDLRLAALTADNQNQYALANYVLWLFNFAPAGSWGFEGAMNQYLRAFHEDKDSRKQTENSSKSEGRNESGSDYSKNL